MADAEIKELLSTIVNRLDRLDTRMDGLEQRIGGLEDAFRVFRNETGHGLDRLEGLFAHVVKKWIEHDADLDQLKRRA